MPTIQSAKRTLVIFYDDIVIDALESVPGINNILQASLKQIQDIYEQTLTKIKEAAAV